MPIKYLRKRREKEWEIEWQAGCEIREKKKGASVSF